MCYSKIYRPSGLIVMAKLIALKGRHTLAMGIALCKHAQTGNNLVNIRSLPVSKSSQFMHRTMPYSKIYRPFRANCNGKTDSPERAAYLSNGHRPL